MRRPNFFLYLALQVGSPILSATTVVCLLSGEFELSHGILIAVGLGLVVFSYWYRQGS